MNIYVGNLHYKITEEALREAFEEYGEVTSVKIVKDRVTGNSRGFGFVEMSDDSGANRAIEALNGAELWQREMVVNEARPRKKNFEGGGGGGGGNFNRRSY